MSAHLRRRLARAFEVDGTTGRKERGEATVAADAWPSAPPSLKAAERLRLRAPDREDVARAWEMEAAHRHLFLFVPVLLGAGAAIWFSVATPPPAWVTAGVASVFFAAALRRGNAAVAPIVVFLLLCGMLLAEWQTRRASTVLLDTPVTTFLSGRVEAREVGPAGDWRYLVTVTETSEPTLKRPPVMVTLVTRATHDPFAVGDAMTGRVRLSPPSGPALPGGNDFAFQAYFRGVGAVGYVLGAPQRPTDVDDALAASADDESFAVTAGRLLQAVRTTATDRIRSVISGDAGAFAAAIITGERRGMSEATVEALRISGLAHVISISGLHMALAAGLFFVGMRLLLSLSVGLAHAIPVKKVAAFGALLAATAYLLISGGQVSAVRAYVMMAVMLVAVLIDRPAISLRNLAVAALVIVVIEPSEVVGPSFQMSFAATAALIAGYAAWRNRRRDDGFLPEGLLPAPLRYLAALFGGILLSSIIGGLSTAAFAVDHFHRLGVYSLPANLAAMPVVSFLVMPMALIAMILMPFGLDYIPLKLLGFGLEITIALAREVASWGGDGGIERLPAWFLPCFTAGFVVLTLMRTWLRHAGSVIILATLAAVVVLPRPPAGALLVSEDGGLVGLTGEGGIATNRARPPDFVFSQWQEALQRHTHLKPSEQDAAALADAFREARAAGGAVPQDLIDRTRAAMDSIAANIPPDRFTCLGRIFCLTRLTPQLVVATVEETSLVGLACDRADLVVTPRRLPFRTCRSGARLISADDLRLTGSLEVWPEGQKGLRIRSAISVSPRPWHMHRRYDWRGDDYVTTPVDEVIARISGSGE
ncbi:ComEC/Rec2 family competence protein [Ciceribacter sp. L1K22]|uniref:ComEC/Rec2 family competence protein n=1 Tax=Ciceribacter sp. L1K22 TaxID=2820275 RepID=UPI0032B1CEC2